VISYSKQFYKSGNSMQKTLRWIALVVVLASTMSCQLFYSGTQKPNGLSAVATVTQMPVAAVQPGVSNPDLLNSQDVLVALYERVSPGVVAILVTTSQGGGLGTGFVYDTSGHIITNFHVVDGAETLEVDFPSGYKAYGKVIGIDQDSDLAVVKVDGPVDEFKPVPLGNSDLVKVGQTVVAIGNPFGLTGTMTTGIISAKGRTLDSMHSTPEGGVYTAGDNIQTDAAINPGNSGGPLLNLNGEVIGVNRAIQTDATNSSGEPVNSGIGYAISVGIVKRVVPELIKNGKYDYPYLGMRSLEDISLQQRDALGLTSTIGAYVTDVVAGGPADQAGILGGSRPTDIAGLNAGGDLIIAVEGHPVRVFGDLLSFILENKAAGDNVVLTIERNNQQKEVTITLGKRP
jgi:S1-C subfamily serine protease